MKRLGLFFILFLSFLWACKKDSKPDEPLKPTYTILTGSTASVTNYEAEISGSISNLNGNNLVEHGHVWSTSPNPTIELETKTTLGNLDSDGEYVSQMNGLEKGTKYYVRAYATDKDGTYYGEEITFETTAQFFTIKVSDTYLQNSAQRITRGWVLIYSSAGDLIIKQEVVNGNTYNFDWPTSNTSDEFMLQIIGTDIRNSSLYDEQYTVQCYLNVRPADWILGTAPNYQLTKIGQNTIELGDIDWVYPNEAKNKYSFANFDGVNTLLFDQYFAPDNIFLMYTGVDLFPYYKWIKDVPLNENYSLTSADFTKMTEYVDISLPTNDKGFVYVESEDDLETDIWEYYMVSYKSFNNTSTARAYFPGNTFNGYWSFISLNNGNTQESMIKSRGSIPSTFKQLAADITINNSNIFNYNATITGGTADVVSTTWKYTDYGSPNTMQFVYTINGDVNSVSSFTPPEIPAEIKSLNTNVIDLNKVEYLETKFMDYDTFMDYNQYIKTTFTKYGYTWGMTNERLMKIISASAKTTSMASDNKLDMREIKQLHNK